MNSRVLLVLAIFSASHVVAETDCEAVVAATLEEMRLGAGEGWSDVEEAAARAAAGSSCLKASSGRYGDTLVVEPIGVAAAEEVVAGLGFSQYRVRFHGDLARIEVPASEIERLTDTSCQKWDFGGRVDVLYGTDARFTETDPLGSTWNTH
ncbi:MAG: hypothetical protein ACPGPG_06080, partial [Luminiphilus sp.]